MAEEVAGWSAWGRLGRNRKDTVLRLCAFAARSRPFVAGGHCSFAPDSAGRRRTRSSWSRRANGRNKQGPLLARSGSGDLGVCDAGTMRTRAPRAGTLSLAAVNLSQPSPSQRQLPGSCPCPLLLIIAASLLAPGGTWAQNSKYLKYECNPRSRECSRRMFGIRGPCAARLLAASSLHLKFAPVVEQLHDAHAPVRGEESARIFSHALRIACANVCSVPRSWMLLPTCFFSRHRV